MPKPYSLDELKDTLTEKECQLFIVEATRERLRHECRSISDTIAILSAPDKATHLKSAPSGTAGEFQNCAAKRASHFLD